MTLAWIVFAMSVSAIAGMYLDRWSQRQHPVAWRCKDYADGWFIFYDRAQAEKYQSETDCLMQPLVVPK